MKNFGTYLFYSTHFQNELKQVNINNTNLSHKKLTFNVPDTFEGNKVWSEFFEPIQNQSNCISCWAFASLFVLSSRLAIYTLGKYKMKFSVAKMVFTEHVLLQNVENNLLKGIPFDFLQKEENVKVNKCNKESLLYAWQYLYRYGVPEKTCVDDKLENVYSQNQLFGATFDVCPSTKKEMINHRIDGYYYVPGTISKNQNFMNGTEMNIRKEIYHWGPCCTTMKIFDDFLNWDGKGIYKWNGITNKFSPDVGHAVVIVGWGQENGVPYWIIRNTWGVFWGDNGYFKMIRGVNNCEIEENVIVGFPNLPSIRLYIEHPILYTIDDYILRNLWGVQDNGYKATTLEKKLVYNRNLELSKQLFLYDPKYWTDFSRMIAGNKNTIRFNLQSIETFRHINQKNTFNIYFFYFLFFALFIFLIRKSNLKT